MAYEALKYYSNRAMTFRFVSNVDGTDFVETTRDLDPAEALFIVSSKTFTTLETMTNAQSARDWSLQGLGGDAKAVASISSRFRQMQKRSLNSASTPPTCSSSGLGWRPLLDGLGDRPFNHAGHRPIISAPCWRASTRSTSISGPRRSRNLPVLMGLLGVWYNDFFGAQTVAVLAYEAYLKRFPTYLQ
jgi:glucose-6-phosphate isomerase